MINRREFLRFSGAAAAVAASRNLLAAPAAETRTRGRPNLLLVLSDDHAAHALGCYGSRINKTPSLDRLAAEGMLFRNCFCTNSICAPSRAVILTGRYSHLNGVTDNRARFDGAQETFPKLLQKAGYQTAIVGKWHLKSRPTGFDYWNVLPGQGSYHDPALIEMGRRRAHKGYVSDVITDQALRWLRGRKAGRPFCLLCHHKAPHRNWQPPPRHARLYENVEIPEPVTFHDDYRTRSDAARRQAMTVEHHLSPSDLKARPPKRLTGKALKKWKYQRYIKDYLRCVASVDESVGRLLAYLDEAHLAENTVVIYTSDQGFFLGDHGWYDKRFMYEPSLRMPLLVRYPPLIKRRAVAEQMVLNLDFAPTMLDLAGAEAPPEMQGQSLRPILTAAAPKDWRTSIYYHYYEYPGAHSVRRHYGVRTERYKLIRFYGDINAWELYDLAADPDERNSLYGRDDWAQTIARLKAELKRLRKKFKDNTGPPV